MSQYDELKRLAEGLPQLPWSYEANGFILAWDGTERSRCENVGGFHYVCEGVSKFREYLLALEPAKVLALIAENERLGLELKDFQWGASVEAEAGDEARTEVSKLRAEIAGLRTGYQAYERVNAELQAEVEEFKAVAAQPASLNASPAAEYEALKRQFFALRNYALCKDKLSGYYSRELEKLRGVDRFQSAGEIDAERDINEQLTNDLLSAEARIEDLRKDAERLDFIESQNHKTLRFHKKKWSVEGFTNYEYSVFKSLREAIDAAMGKGEQ